MPMLSIGSYGRLTFTAQVLEGSRVQLGQESLRGRALGLKVFEGFGSGFRVSWFRVSGFRI